MRRIISLFALLLIVGCSASGPGPEVDSKPSARSDSWRAEILQAEQARRWTPALEALSSSEDAAQRRLAIRAGGRIGGADASAAVRRGFEDAEAAVRAEAATAAGMLGDDAWVDPLIFLARDEEPSVRSAVAVALGLMNDAKTHPTIFSLLDDDEGEVRATACYAAARQNDADGLSVKVLEKFDDEDRNVVLAAIYAASRMSGRVQGLTLDQRTSVRRTLLSLARAPNETIRMLVAEGMFNPLAGEQADTLHKMFEVYDDPTTKFAFLRSTSLAGAPTFVFHEPAVLSEDPMIVYATVLGLARMKGDSVNAILLDRIIRDEHRWIQIAAMRSLRQTERKVALEVANGLSKDGNARIRRVSAELLYGQEGDKAQEFARRLFAANDPRTRLAAIPAMAAVDAPLAKSFEALLPDASHDTLEAMARAVGYRLKRSDVDEADRETTRRFLADLWERSTDEQPLVRLAILTASDDAAISTEIQRKALKDGHALVRAAAASRLGEKAPAAELGSIKRFEEIAAWAETPRAAIVTVERPGFLPGRFTIRLDTENAPVTSYEFARRAGEGYFNNRPVHRLIPGLRVHSGASGEDRAPQSGWRAEPLTHGFAPGTLAAVPTAGDHLFGEWFITLQGRPNYLGRYYPFGFVVRNLDGVVKNIQPQDRVVSIEVYEGDGTEALAPLN